MSPEAPKSPGTYLLGPLYPKSAQAHRCIALRGKPSISWCLGVLGKKGSHAYTVLGPQELYSMGRSASVTCSGDSGCSTS